MRLQISADLRQHERRHKLHDEGVHVRRPGGAIESLGEVLEGPSGALEVSAADLHAVRRLTSFHAAQRRMKSPDVVKDATLLKTNVHRLVGVALEMGQGQGEWGGGRGGDLI